ncbi:hypothetical protein Tco_0474877 [Tanacetum coccineum]
MSPPLKVSDDEDEVETTVVVKKKTIIPTAAKIEKPVRKPVRYAEMYRSQRPRGNQRNWNGQKSNQLGSRLVNNVIGLFNTGNLLVMLDGCTNSGEARVQQRKRRIQRRVQQKQKDQEDEVFGRILSAKKMKLVLLEENSSYCSRLQLPVLNQSVNTARITVVGEKVNAAESLLVVSTEVNAN